MKEEFSGFASLSRCILIESSFRARNELNSSIKSVALFEQVTQPKSLDHAERQIKGLAFDACVVGPAINREKAANFITSVKGNTYSADCAFIATLYPSRWDERGDISVEYHSVSKVGHTRREFFDGVVIGILKACKDSPWPGVKLNENGQILVANDDNWTPLSDADTFVYHQGLSDAFRVLRGTDLSKKLSLVLQCDENAAEALKGVNDSDTLFLFKAVQQWRKESQTMSEKTASENLKMKLRTLLVG